MMTHDHVTVANSTPAIIFGLKGRGRLFCPCFPLPEAALRVPVLPMQTSGMIVFAFSFIRALCTGGGMVVLRLL